MQQTLGSGFPSLGSGSLSLGFGSPSLGLGSSGPPQKQILLSQQPGQARPGQVALTKGFASGEGLRTPGPGLGTQILGLGTQSLGLGTPSLVFVAFLLIFLGYHVPPTVDLSMFICWQVSFWTLYFQLEPGTLNQ